MTLPAAAQKAFARSLSRATVARGRELTPVELMAAALAARQLLPSAVYSDRAILMWIGARRFDGAFADIRRAALKNNKFCDDVTAFAKNLTTEMENRKLHTHKATIHVGPSEGVVG